MANPYAKYVTEEESVNPYAKYAVDTQVSVADEPKDKTTAGDLVGDVAIGVGGTAIPAILGGIVGTGVLGPGFGTAIGAGIGGMLGGGASGALVQGREMERQDIRNRKDFSVGREVADIGVGAIPFSPVAPATSAIRTLAKTVGVRGAQGFGLGAAHSGTRQLIDTGSIDLGDLAIESGIGGVLGGIIGGGEAKLTGAMAASSPKMPSVAAAAQRKSIIPSMDEASSQGDPLKANSMANQIGRVEIANDKPLSQLNLSELTPGRASVPEPISGGLSITPEGGVGALSGIAPSEPDISLFAPRGTTKTGRVSKLPAKITLGGDEIDVPPDVRAAALKAISVFEEIPPAYIHPPEANLTPLLGGALNELTPPPMEFGGGDVLPPAESSAIGIENESQILERLRQSRIGAEKLQSDLAAEQANPPKPKVINVKPRKTDSLGRDAGVLSEVEPQPMINYAGAETSPDTITLGELIGQRVNAFGYKGTLTRQADGTIVLVQDVTKGTPNIVEIPGSGKDLNKKAKDVGVSLGRGVLSALSRGGVSVAEPVFGALAGKAAAKLTGQDEKTEEEWTKRGFLLGAAAVAGAHGLARVSMRPGVQDLGAAAFHGTPHKVEKFSTKKIGTGEGSQAYGYGLYFAENPNVSKSYQRGTQTVDPYIAIDGQKLHPRNSVEGVALSHLWNHKGSIDSALSSVKKLMSGYPPGAMEQAVANLESLRGRKIEAKGGDITPGNLYKVDLDIKPEETLIWDKPLSKQSKAVRDKIDELAGYEVLDRNGDIVRRFKTWDEAKAYSDEIPELGRSVVKGRFGNQFKVGEDMTGQQVYHVIADKIREDSGAGFGSKKISEIAEKEASEKLNSLGIKGIKYSDQGSRGKPEAETITGKELFERERAAGFTETPAPNPVMSNRWFVVKKGTPEALADGDVAIYGYKDRSRAEKWIADNQPTHNYVIFDDSRIKILDENGVPVKKPNQMLPSGRNPEAGVLYNPLKTGGTFSKKLSQINSILATEHQDGTITIEGYSDSGVKSKPKKTYGSFRVPLITERFDPKDIESYFGKTVSDKIFRELIRSKTGEFPLQKGDTVAISGFSSVDFPHAIGNQSGKVPFAVLANLSAPVAGGITGYQFGDTPEEKRQNAFYGALAFSGGALGAKAMATIGSKNKTLLNALQGLKRAKEVQRRGTPPEAPKESTLTLGEAISDPWMKPEETASMVDKGISEAFKAWEPSLLGRTGIGKALNHLGTVTDNLRRIHPQVAGAVRQREQRINDLYAPFHNDFVPSILNLRKFVGNKDFEKLGEMLMSGGEAHVLAALDETPGGKEIADGLRNGWIAKRGAILEAWRKAYPEKDIFEVEGYWPRVVSDADGLKKAIGHGNEDRTVMRDALEKARKKKAAQTENPDAVLTPEEEGVALSDLIEGSKRFPGTPGFLKTRTLQSILEKGKFFEPADVALDRYGSSISSTIATREFLGKVEYGIPDPWIKANTDEGGPIGALVAKLIREGKISEDGEREIKRNINALINSPEGDPTFRRAARIIGSIQTGANLGQPRSAIPQLADVFLSAATLDVPSAARGFGRALFKTKGRRTMDDINLMSGTPETREFSRIGSTDTKIVNAILKPIFNWSDRVGKETFMNAVELWAEKNARKMASGGKEDMNFHIAQRKNQEMFGDHEWQKMLKEMRDGNWLSPELKKFMFNELSDVQAISRSELPLGLLKSSPLGRIPWRLMSFALRQIGLARSRVYDAARQGHKAEAALWAARYTTFMIMGGSMVQYARDTASGKEDSITDYVFGSLLQMAGISKVAVGQTTRGEFGDVVADRLAPGLWGPVRDVQRDLAGLRDIATGRKDISEVDSEAVKRVPLVGQLYYDWVGGGKRKEAEKARKRTEEKALPLEVYESILGSESRRRR